MKFSLKIVFTTTRVMLLVLLTLAAKPVATIRASKGEEVLGEKNSVSIPQEKGPVPPVASSPCTYINGGSSGGNCKTKG